MSDAVKRFIVATAAVLTLVAVGLTNASIVWTALKHFNLSIVVTVIAVSVLLILGFDACRAWLESRFCAVDERITKLITERDKAAEVRESRLAAIDTRLQDIERARRYEAQQKSA